jgi:hypothetical protein
MVKIRQNASKMGQNTSKMRQNASKMRQNPPKIPNIDSTRTNGAHDARQHEPPRIKRNKGKVVPVFNSNLYIQKK